MLLSGKDQFHNSSRTSILLISQDLGVITDAAGPYNRMYCGYIVETAGIEDLFYRRAHPYTEGPMNSNPALSKGQRGSARSPDAPPALT